MWLELWLTLTVLYTAICPSDHASVKLDYHEPLDYSHDIFIPADAYKNYELFMEYVEGSEIDRRTTVSLPNLADLPADGEFDYRVEVNCNLKLLTENGKRVLKRTSCSEGWSLKSALIQLFQNQNDITQQTGGLLHYDNLRFQKMVFENGGFTLSGDTEGAAYSHIQTNTLLTDVQFEMFVLPTYSFESSIMKLSGSQDVKGKTMNVNFLKDQGSSLFKCSYTIALSSLENFMKIYLEDAKVDGTSILSGVKIDTLKPVMVSANGEDTFIKGIFNPTDTQFQLTLKSKSSDNTAFGGNNVDIYATFQKKDVGSSALFALSIGYPKSASLSDVIGNYVTSTDQFNNKLLTNAKSKWFISLSSGDFEIYNENSYRNIFSSIFEGSTKFAFSKGVGFKLPVDLKKTLETCKPNTSVDASYSNVRMSGQLSFGKGLEIKYPENVVVPMESLVKCADSSLASEIPDALAALESATGFTLEKCSYDTTTGNIELEVGYSRPVILVKDLIEIRSPKFAVKKEQDEEDTSVYTWTYTLSAELTVFGASANCSIEYSDNVITGTITSKVISITTIWQTLTGSPPPKLTFEIHEFNLEITKNLTKGATDFKLQVTGKPVINGFDKLLVETLVWQKDGTAYGVACAVKFTDIRLDEVLEKVLGLDEVPMAWFSKMQLLVAISNTDAAGCDNPAQDEDSCEEQEEEEEDENTDAADDTVDDADTKKKLKPRKKPFTRRRKRSTKVGQRRNTKVARRRSTKVGQRKEVKKQNTAIKRQDKPKKRAAILENLKEMDLVRGLYVKASFFMPDDCKKDGLCEWMKEKLSADTNLFLEGTFSSDGVELEAGIESESGIPLSDDLSLTGASLKLTLTTSEKKVELKCSLMYDNPKLSPDKLNFTGAISVSFSGTLEISLIMSGIIYQPFGIKPFAFGNLILAVGITIAAGLPSLQIGAEVHIGNVKNEPGKGGVFKFAGYFGFNPADPMENYCYIRSFGDDLTLINILKNFGISQDPKLPEPVANSGFFGELIISFSSQGKQIEELGLDIKAGFYFKGNLRIFDLEVYSEICINTDKDSPAIFANITITPISWVGGLLRIQRSREDDKNGPYLVVDIDTSKVRVDVEGFAYCLGISIGIKVHFNETHSYFYIEGDIFSVLRANLTVEATYGGALADMSYQFEGCVSFDLERIVQYVKAAMEDAKRAVSNAMNKAKMKVEAARGAANAGFDAIRGWESNINSYQETLRARSRELERRKAELNYSCKDRCGKVCVGFLDWNPHCWKCWGHWVGCPSWNSCRWRVDDIICIAGCELKRAWNKFVAWAEQVGIQIMLGLTEIAKFLLRGVEVFRGLVNAVLDFANAFLDGVEGFCNGILTAVTAIVEAVGNIIKIEYFCISGHLKPVESACVRCRAKMEIFTKPVEWDGELCIDLSFFKSVGKKTAVTHTPDIQLIDEKTEQYDSECAKIDDDVKNMKEEQGKQESEIKSKAKAPNLDRRRRRRTYVPTQEEAYYYEQAYGHIPEPDIRNAKTEKAMYEDAPWVIAKTWKPAKRDTIPEETTAHKRILPLDVKDDCKRMEHVYSNYDKIAEGFNAFFNAMERQKAGFYSMKRSYIEGMNYIKNEFDYGDKKHNVTDEEREHIKYWHDYVINGLSQHIKDTEALMRSERKTYIPSFRENVDVLFGEQSGAKLPDYIDQMHNAVTKTYDKRSDIPSPVLTERTKKWKILRNAFKSIAAEKTGTIREFAQRLAEANRILHDLRRSEIPCAA